NILFLELTKLEINNVSKRVNEMIRQRENRQSLKELKDRFIGRGKELLLQNNRVLIYQGFLTKVRRYKIRYYFHLFNDILVYSELTSNNGYKLHRIIQLNESNIKDLPSLHITYKHIKNNQTKVMF